MKKMDWRNGWKVLRRHNKILRSALVNKAGIRYVAWCRMVPRPDCGPLCVFEDIVSAESFVRTRTRLTGMFSIRPCIYRLSRDKWVWCPDTTGRSGGKYWRQSLEKMPEGTQLAKEVVIMYG